MTDHDTDPCPPTEPNHDRPEPSGHEIIARVEALAAALADGVGTLLRLEARLEALAPDLALVAAEVRRHGQRLSLLPCAGGGNGGVPAGCPEAAE